MSMARLRRPRPRGPSILARLLDWLVNGSLEPARRNPGRLRGARAASQRFHGSPRHVTKVDGEEKVVIGTLEAIEYRTPRGSRRRGLWRHKAGDIGRGKRALRGRAKVLADPDTGDLDIDGGPVEFKPDRGIYG